jgi:cytochrome P450
MREPRLMIIEPDLVNEILIKKFQFFKDNEFCSTYNTKIDPLFSRSPYLSRNESWREFRSEIVGALSSFRMAAIFPVIENVCESFYSHILSNINKPIEARDLSVRFTVDIVANCIFNIDSDCLSADNEIKRMSKRLSLPSTNTIISMLAVEIFPALKNILSIKVVSHDVEKFFLNFFDRAMRRRKNGTYQVEDFLDYVISLREKKKLSHKEIAGHLTTFFSDGLESTSLLIAHTLYEVMGISIESFVFILLTQYYSCYQLAKNENVQVRLREEINNFIDAYGVINYDILNEMPYLEMIINGKFMV